MRLEKGKKQAEVSPTKRTLVRAYIRDFLVTVLTSIFACAVLMFLFSSESYGLEPGVIQHQTIKRR